MFFADRVSVSFTHSSARTANEAGLMIWVSLKLYRLGSGERDRDRDRETDRDREGHRGTERETHTQRLNVAKCVCLRAENSAI